MDNQQLFNVVMAVAGFLAAYVLNSMTRTIQKLEDRVSAMPITYVSKDDYRSDISEIKKMLHDIFDKIDKKADKAG